MSTGKLVLYAIAGLLALLVVSFVVNTILAIVSTVLFAIKLLAVLAVVGGVAYAGYRIYSLVSGLTSSSSNAETTSSSETDSLSTGIGTSDTSATRSDNLRQQYLNGDISEEEFERRLERELDSDEFDSIDRELQRDRI
jgi:uncharacterized membrane protein YeiB